MLHCAFEPFSGPQISPGFISNSLDHAESSKHDLALSPLADLPPSLPALCPAVTHRLGLHAKGLGAKFQLYKTLLGQ